MSKRYSGKSFKDSSVMKKAKLTLKEKRKIKREKKKNNPKDPHDCEFNSLGISTMPKCLSPRCRRSCSDSSENAKIEIEFFFKN